MNPIRLSLAAFGAALAAVLLFMLMRSNPRTVEIAPERSAAHPRARPDHEMEAVEKTAADPTSPVEVETTKAVPAFEGRAEVAVSNDSGASTSSPAIDIDSLQSRIAELERTVDRLARELQECRFPESSPWGAALLSSELKDLDDGELGRVKHFLDDLPIMLRPGEITWIAERYRRQDMRELGGTVTAYLNFFGRERFLSDLPPDVLAQIRANGRDDWRFRMLFPGE